MRMYAFLGFTLSSNFLDLVTTSSSSFLVIKSRDSFDERKRMRVGLPAIPQGHSRQ